jgi:hypothetical protein
VNFIRAAESSTTLPVRWPGIEKAEMEPHFNLQKHPIFKRYQLCSSYNFIPMQQ